MVTLPLLPSYVNYPHRNTYLLRETVKDHLWKPSIRKALTVRHTAEQELHDLGGHCLRLTG